MQNTKDTHGKWTVSWPNNRSKRRRFYGDQSNKCWTLQHLHPLVTIIVTRPHYGLKYLYDKRLINPFIQTFTMFLTIFLCVLCNRHGFRMLRNPWADGPSYVTQCPIQPGGSYTYRFTIQNQEGTLWWHAHTGFLRATVYGAFIIYPKMGSPYPFSMPTREFPILLGNLQNHHHFIILKRASLINRSK